WTEAEKSYVLSSFNWGHVLVQIPGSLLVRYFGVRTTLILSTFGVAALSAITPTSLKGKDSYKIYCIIRLAQGLFQGLSIPCVHEHLAKWSPPLDRKLLGVIAYSGIYCGTILAPLASGAIAGSLFGWPAMMYLSALLGFLWCLLWWFLGENNAGSSHLIDVAEREYIKRAQSFQCACLKNTPEVPWAAIVRSVPFRALVIVTCAQDWIDSTIEVEIPSYLNGVLGMSIEKNGMTAALPHLVQWIMSYVYLLTAHVAIIYQIIGRTPLRKCAVTVSTWGPAALYIAIGFLDQRNTSLVVVLMTIKAGLKEGTDISGFLNAIDLSPNHATVLLGIMSAVTVLPSPLGPLLIGAIVTDPMDQSQWQIIFALMGMVFFLSNWVFILWGSSELQPWDSLGIQHSCSDEYSRGCNVS
ncbi:hypothetical protein KR018_003982, partial [Drosophila ironensis]